MRIQALLVHGMLTLVFFVIATITDCVPVWGIEKILEERSKFVENKQEGLDTQPGSLHAALVEMSRIDKDDVVGGTDKTGLSLLRPYRLAAVKAESVGVKLAESASMKKLGGNRRTATADRVQSREKAHGGKAPNAHAAGDADDNSDSDSTDSAPTPVRSPITASLDAESPRVGTECCGSNSPTDTTPDDKVTTNNGYLLVGSAVNNNATPRSPGNTRPPFQAGSADLSHDQEVCAVLSRLGPGDPPLLPGQYLSYACTAASPSPASPSRPEGICLSLSESGKVRITTGYEPSALEMILWEVDGIEETRKKRESRWYRRVGRAIKAKFTRGEATKRNDANDGTKPLAPTQLDKEMDDDLQKEMSDMKLYMDKGRMTLAGTTPHAKSRGGFLGWRKRKTEKTEILYQTPKPKGYWKTSVSMLSKTGREIRESELVASPEGRIAVETADGSVLWEPSLNPTGSELEGAWV